MNILLISERIDAAIRNLFYLLILLLPYSSAAVETCVILALVLWIIKRGLRLYSLSRNTGFHPKLIFRSFRPAPTILDQPITLFVLVCLISVILSKSPLSSFLAFLTKTSEWFVVFYLVRESLTEKRHILIFIRIFIFSALVTALDSLIQFYITGHDIFLGRELTRGGVTAGFNHANGFGGYLTLVIPVASALLLSAGKRRLKILLAPILIALIWTLFMTLSRGAWLSTLIGISFFVFLKAKKFGLYLLIGFVGCILLFYAFAPSDILARVRMDSEDIHNTVSWRWGLWEDSLKMIRERPLFGHGINTFMRLFQQYRRKAFEGNPMLTPQPYSPTYAHNCFVQMTAEVGLLGLSSFAWLIFRFMLGALRVMRSAKTPQRDLGFLSAGFFCGICAFLIHCLFDTDLYSLKLSVYFWLMLGISLNIFQLLKYVKCDIKLNQ